MHVDDFVMGNGEVDDMDDGEVERWMMRKRDAMTASFWLTGV